MKSIIVLSLVLGLILPCYAWRPGEPVGISPVTPYDRPPDCEPIEHEPRYIGNTVEEPYRPEYRDSIHNPWGRYGRESSPDSIKNPVHPNNLQYDPFGDDSLLYRMD